MSHKYLSLRDHMYVAIIVTLLMDQSYVVYLEQKSFDVKEILK